MNMQALARERYVSITTFKRDGTAVPTPVWCVGKNGHLLVLSEADSGKVKRIRHNPHVLVTPCSARGKPHGDAVDADASLVQDTEEIEALLGAKYGWIWSTYTLATAAARRIGRRTAPKAVTISLTLR